MYFIKNKVSAKTKLNSCDPLCCSRNISNSATQSLWAGLKNDIMVKIKVEHLL